MKNLGKLLLCLGVGMLTATAVMWIYAAVSVERDIGIIGGADAPTFWFLLKSGAFTPYFVSGGTGLACVIAGIILRRDRSE